MITSWDDADRAIRAEQEADAREAMQDACTLCGDPIDGEADEFWSCEGEHHRMHPGCSEVWGAITEDRNLLDVPELRNHRREVIEGGVVITYEQRDPGERGWRPVRLFRPDAPIPRPLRPIAPASLPGWCSCPECGVAVPSSSLRDGACQPCRIQRLADLA